MLSGEKAIERVRQKIHFITLLLCVLLCMNLLFNNLLNSYL